MNIIDTLNEKLRTRTEELMKAEAANAALHNEINQLKEDEAALRNDLAAAVADKDRLDWLERATSESHSGVSFDSCRKMGSRMIRFMRWHYLGRFEPGIRAAIDAEKGASK